MSRLRMAELVVRMSCSCSWNGIALRGRCRGRPVAGHKHAGVGVGTCSVHVLFGGVHGRARRNMLTAVRTRVGGGSQVDGRRLGPMQRCRVALVLRPGRRFHKLYPVRQ